MQSEATKRISDLETEVSQLKELIGQYSIFVQSISAGHTFLEACMAVAGESNDAK